MSIHHKAIFLQPALVGLLLTSAPTGAEETQAAANWPTSSAIQTEAGELIPAGAQGIVLINAPREATLLQLRGVVGSGDVILRSGDSRDCLTLPVRFVAGDFGGNAISSHSGQPIRMVLRSTRVALALANGDDVVSDMYRIGKEDDADADIIVESVLSEGHGFVLNPGRSILADIVGVTAVHTTCSER